MPEPVLVTDEAELMYGLPTAPCRTVAPAAAVSTIASGAAFTVATKFADWVSGSEPKENRLQEVPLKYDALLVPNPVLKLESLLVWKPTRPL